MNIPDKLIIQFQKFKIPVKSLSVNCKNNIILDKSGKNHDESTDFSKTDTTDDVYINIQYFCKEKEISDLLFSKAYYLIPNGDNLKEYHLLRKAMISKHVAAIAEIQSDEAHELIAMFPDKNCIIGIILLYENEINELPIIFKSKTKKEDLEELKSAITQHLQPFKWI